jgi:hypothetical protein
MYQIDCRKRFAQVAVVALLTCSAVARANDCAGGSDATGNDCSGAQAVPGLGQADSHLLYLKGATAMASLRLERAKQRLIDAAAALKAADAAVKLEEAELKTARMALQANEKKQQSLLVVKAQ